MSESRPIRILIAEDNEGDAYLLKEALSREVGNCDLHFLNDGDDAFRFLSRQYPYADAPRPDLVVLDLNLPKRDGVELLRFIRTSEELHHLPVTVLSSAPEELVRDSLREADQYLKKPMTLEAYMKIGHDVMECYKNARKCRKLTAPHSSDADASS